MLVSGNISTAQHSVGIHTDRHLRSLATQQSHTIRPQGKEAAVTPITCKTMYPNVQCLVCTKAQIAIVVAMTK